MGQNRTRNTLKRVAEALSVSEDVFLDDGSRGVLTVPAISEELELLRLFAAITDPEVRQTCLRYVRDLAQCTDIAAG